MISQSREGRMCNLTGDGLSRLGRRDHDCHCRSVVRCTEDGLGGERRYVVFVIPVVFFVFGCSKRACIDAFYPREPRGCSGKTMRALTSASWQKGSKIETNVTTLWLSRRIHAIRLWIMECYWSEEGFNYDLSLWFLRW